MYRRTHIQLERMARTRATLSLCALSKQRTHGRCERERTKSVAHKESIGELFRACTRGTQGEALGTRPQDRALCIFSCILFCVPYNVSCSIPSFPVPSAFACVFLNIYFAFTFAFLLSSTCVLLQFPFRVFVRVSSCAPTCVTSSRRPYSWISTVAFLRAITAVDFIGFTCVK